MEEMGWRVGCCLIESWELIFLIFKPPQAKFLHPAYRECIKSTQRAYLVPNIDPSMNV
jgi:hypothetical protein